MTALRLIALQGVIALSAVSAAALPPAEKCEVGKLKQAGKYGFCRLKAEANSVKSGNAPDYSKCDEKYELKWTDLESEGGVQCPTLGDQDVIATFINEHTDDVATALSGGGLAGRGQRVQTGQTTCYDSTNMVIPCAGTGQDGDLQKGLGASFTDNGDGTITDHRTGLMWEKHGDDGSIHDKDTLYEWADAFVMKIATLNATTFAGYSDWRLPNINELQSLINYSGVVPAVHSPFHTGCVAGCTIATCACTHTPNEYWSSTTWPYGTGTFRAYTVEYIFGIVLAFDKDANRVVRAVRGGT